MTEPIDVVADTERAAVLLHPTRLRILELLLEPMSAASLAPRLRLPRQLVNYHLRELAAQDLVAVVTEKRRGSVTERSYQRTAHSYAIAPQALGAVGGGGAAGTGVDGGDAASSIAAADRFSSAHQVLMANRVLHELTELRAGAAAAKKTLPTFALEFDVRFADAKARSAFAQELGDLVAALVEKHHDERTPGGRTFHWYLGGYPRQRRGR